MSTTPDEAPVLTLRQRAIAAAREREAADAAAVQRNIVRHQAEVVFVLERAMKQILLVDARAWWDDGTGCRSSPTGAGSAR